MVIVIKIIFLQSTDLCLTSPQVFFLKTSKTKFIVFGYVQLWQHATINYSSHKASKSKQKQQQKHFNG